MSLLSIELRFKCERINLLCNGIYYFPRLYIGIKYWMCIITQLSGKTQINVKGHTVFSTVCKFLGISSNNPLLVLIHYALQTEVFRNI